jgi:hypothetical protein
MVESAIRERVDVRTQGNAEAPNGAPAAPAEIAAQGRLVVLEEGLFALSLGAVKATPGITGVAVPAISVTTPPSEEYDPVEIAATSGDEPSWFGPQGGVAVVKAPPGGGVVLVTTYGPPQATAAITVEVRRLDRARPAAVAATERALRSEIVLHIEREGDRRFVADGWVGNRGQRLRVEAFSIRPLEALATGDIEYKAFGPNGRETPWVTDARLCGTRGRGLPLTGFAVRVAPHLRGRFDVVYEGSFFASGVAGPCRNGEPCMAKLSDDPLEAMHLRLIERGE